MLPILFVRRVATRQPHGAAMCANALVHRWESSSCLMSGAAYEPPDGQPARGFAIPGALYRLAQAEKAKSRPQIAEQWTVKLVEQIELLKDSLSYIDLERSTSSFRTKTERDVTVKKINRARISVVLDNVSSVMDSAAKDPVRWRGYLEQARLPQLGILANPRLAFEQSKAVDERLTGPKTEGNDPKTHQFDLVAGDVVWWPGRARAGRLVPRPSSKGHGRIDSLFPIR